MDIFQKIINYFWSLRKEFAKYFITGIVSVVLDMLSLIFLKEVCGVLPVFAVVINQIFLMGFVFLMNKHWSFREKSMPQKQLVRFLLLTGVNYLFSVGAMYIFNHSLGFDYRLVRLASIAMMVSWNFILYKNWVYK
ncbi:MAG: GtrA family protein [Patescibacteria group bacterium]|nr:GtrA family protein [Patescibacteria group bacterium]